MITQWNPSEIIIHRKVVNDPVTRSILEKCKGIFFQFVDGADPKSVVQASEVLPATHSNMLDTIIAGKQVLFVAPASNNTVDTFSMPDDRMLCPHFNRLKLASNGCVYQCDWCYLKLTYVLRAHKLPHQTGLPLNFPLQRRIQSWLRAIQ